MKNFFQLSIFGIALLYLPDNMSAQKMSAVVPIVDVKSGYLLGGSRGGKWIGAKSTAQFLKSGASYRLFNATKFLGNARFSEPKSQGAPCPDTLFTQVSPGEIQAKWKLNEAEFAIGNARHPMPHPLRIESTNQASYRNIVASILKARGIVKPVVGITQIWRVDLDGDGTQEVLLSATRKDDSGQAQSIAPDSRAGDYSLVLLRKIVRGEVKNSLLEGDFYPRAKKFNAPGFHRLAAVFDANGDGKMEVLLRGRYYEGDWVSLYEMHGEKPGKVLSEGCGA
ncbi:hypothetical protein B1R32_10452 [Abditibacterium utsteinense]|uniref:Uncharacterized protein n=1 Tax=Abditibacterium utsteinense TaxID=1960156 RepID=A0A2S8SUW0_9BACT|nr:hypothetical protein [Abditibacterium utsteinense]PQV64559.1 hypothetical protein B1R32_10452 [Abditibacterium utsteinense]